VGYRGHDGWKDMSDFVVHFTKPPAADTSVATAVQASGGGGLHTWLAEQRAQDRSGYHPWIKILGEGRLCAGEKPLGAARSQPALAELHRGCASARFRSTCSSVWSSGAACTASGFARTCWSAKAVRRCGIWTRTGCRRRAFSARSATALPALGIRYGG
jgi:hypothetical protein